MKKRGFVWISAVLYIALGIVAISLVMTAGLPLINKMKDRNTILQTKELMHTIDKNIWQVRSEGVGSRRFLEPVIIKGGKLAIDDKDNKIMWEMKTNAKVIEPEYDHTEGNLVMWADFTNVEGEYLVQLMLDYGSSDVEKIDLIIEGDYTSGSSLVGKSALSIENKVSDQSKPVIVITVI